MDNLLTIFIVPIELELEPLQKVYHSCGLLVSDVGRLAPLRHFQDLVKLSAALQLYGYGLENTADPAWSPGVTGVFAKVEVKLGQIVQWLCRVQTLHVAF